MIRPLLLALPMSLALACGAASAQPVQPVQSPNVLPSQAAQPLKMLRYAFPVAESSFDPAQITDLYSRTVASGIFDAPLEFEFLANPARM